MKARMEFADPESVRVTLTITLPVSEWKSVRDLVQEGVERADDKWCGWRFVSMISEAIRRTAVYVEEEAEVGS